MLFFILKGFEYFLVIILASIFIMTVPGGAEFGKLVETITLTLVNYDYSFLLQDIVQVFQSGSDVSTKPEVMLTPSDYESA